MSIDLVSLSRPNIRGADSNSLLRVYDLAIQIFNKSPHHLERTKADKALRRIAQELQKRNVPL